MTKRKRNREVSQQDSQQKSQDNKLHRQQDRQWRQLRTKIHTQLDNAFVEFMYIIENENIEIEKNTENHLINTWYEPRTVKMIEEAIKSDEKQLKNLVSAARRLAKHLVKMNRVKQKKRVEVRDLEQSLQEVEFWPITILNLKYKEG